MAVFPSSPPLHPAPPSSFSRRHTRKSPTLPTSPQPSPAAASEEASILRALEQKLSTACHPPPPPTGHPALPSSPLRLLSLTSRLVASLFPSVQYIALPSDELPPSSQPSLISLYGHSYDLTAFARVHPGGSVILQSVTGTDCTDFFAVNHPQTPRPAGARHRRRPPSLAGSSGPCTAAPRPGRPTAAALSAAPCRGTGTPSWRGWRPTAASAPPSASTSARPLLTALLLAAVVALILVAAHARPSPPPPPPLPSLACQPPWPSPPMPPHRWPILHSPRGRRP